MLDLLEHVLKFSFYIQTIINQESRDRSVYKLLWKIREIYEFMIAEGELDKIRLMPDVLASLSEQVVECTKFLKKYSYLARLCRAIILQPCYSSELV